MVLSAAPLQLQAAIIFTETWSENGNFRDWNAATLAPRAGGTNAFSVSNGTVNFQVDSFAIPAQRGFQLSASHITGVRNPSDNNFRGNLVTAGARSVRFDFALDSDNLGTAEMPTLVLFMGGVDPDGFNNYWEYHVTPPTIGAGFITVVADLTNPSGWVQTLGSRSFIQATQNVQTWAVLYKRFQPAGPNSGFTASGRIDNFGLSTAIPEPSLSMLMSVCGVFMLLRRRRSMTARW